MDNTPEGEDRQIPQSQPTEPASPVFSPPAEPIVGAPPLPVSAPPPPQPPVTSSGVTATPPAVTADQSHDTRESSHILQWLTSMFWGLTVLALASLTISVFQRLMVGTDSSTFNYYMVATLVILLPLAFACDVIYAKQEPEKKVGAASRIMAAYAIIFALFGIGALLSIAWNIVAWATGSGVDHSSSEADITSALFIFLYYLVTFMRTLNPTHRAWMPKVYRFTMLGIVIVFIILGFTKPTLGSKPAVSTNSSSSLSSSLGGSGSGTSSSTPSNNFGPNGKLEPSVVGGTQCSIPKLSDGSVTGQVAITGGATCDEAEANIQSATGKNGGNYTANGYSCTSTKQGSGTQWSDYWSNNFYSYNCSAGSKQTAFNLQTTAQSPSSTR